MENIITVNVNDLKFHESYYTVYDKNPNRLELMVDSIQKEGLLVPITITETNVVISGVLRVLACRLLGIKTIPAIIREDRPYEEMKLSIIQHNRQRIKSVTELYNELKELKKLWGQKQGTRNDLKEGTHDEVLSTRAKIALHLNMSESNIGKLDKIGAERPDLLPLIDKKELTIGSAHKLIKAKEKERTENPEMELEKIYKHVCPHCKKGHN